MQEGGFFLKQNVGGEFGGGEYIFTMEKRSSTRVMHGVVGKTQGNLCSPFLKCD